MHFDVVELDAIQLNAVGTDVVEPVLWCFVMMLERWRIPLWGAPSLVTIGCGPPWGAPHHYLRVARGMEHSNQA